jgi:hypothetical protein
MKNLHQHWIGAKLIQYIEADIPESRMPLVFYVAKEVE